MNELPGDAGAAVKKALIVGVATGQNPRTVARMIRQELGGNLVRALTISRTEMLRSYREASYRSAQVNKDILSHWVWHSALQARSCMACIALHGSKHPVDERMDDHVNGRCTQIFITKSWEEILGGKGADIPDTRPQVEMGTDWFARQPESVQRQMMGPAKYAAWKAGEFDLKDLLNRNRSSVWGTTRSEKSLKQVLREKHGDVEGAKLAAQYIQAGRSQATMVRKTYRLAEYSPKLKNALARAEQELAGETVETLRVFDLQGKPILTISGESAGIPMTDEQVAACKDMIVTHNHPMGTSFSDLDVKLLLDFGAREIRAVGQEFIYSLSVPEPTDFEDVAPAIAHVFRRLVDEDTIACNTSGRDMEELVATRWHRIWEEIAEIRGWIYRREKQK